MVEWEGGRGGGTGSVISGAEKRAWSRCKSALQGYDPNWKQKGTYHGGWFTWADYRHGRYRVQARLDRVYGTREDISFSGRLRPLNVLMDGFGPFSY